MLTGTLDIPRRPVDGRNAVDTCEGRESRRAVSRAVPGVGIELRFLWNDDTRATQMYRTSVELAAAAATAKREELHAAGWVGAPPHWQM